MSSFLTATKPGLRQGKGVSRSTGGDWSCLLLSPDELRRTGLSKAARSAGWRVVACDTVRDAMRQHQRWLTHLTAIDLSTLSDEQQKELRDFAEHVGANNRLLLICDEPTSPDAELWARQAGAWAYLPSPDFEKGLVDLFGEALRVASKSSLATSVAR